MIHVFLADDHAMVRSGLRLVLEAYDDLTVVGEAGNGWEVLRALEDQRQPIDVLLLDLSMPRLGGVEVLRRALEARPSLAILILSMYPAEHWAQPLLEAGARAYVSKNEPSDTLVAKIRAAASGRELSPQPPLTETTARPHHSLTGRELQIFLLIITSHSVTDVAAALNLGQSTVSTHLARIRKKLKIDTVAGLVTYAHREGLVN